MDAASRLLVLSPPSPLPILEAAGSLIGCPAASRLSLSSSPGATHVSFFFPPSGTAVSGPGCPSRSRRLLRGGAGCCCCCCPPSDTGASMVTLACSQMGRSPWPASASTDCPACERTSDLRVCVGGGSEPTPPPKLPAAPPPPPPPCELLPRPNEKPVLGPASSTLGNRRSWLRPKEKAELSGAGVAVSPNAPGAAALLPPPAKMNALPGCASPLPPNTAGCGRRR
jgi:hypothetical protein